MPICRLLPGGRQLFWHQGVLVKMEPDEERFVPYRVWKENKARFEVIEEDASVVERKKELEMYTTDVKETMTQSTEVVEWPLRVNPEYYLKRYGQNSKYSAIARKCLGKE
jgi:hypothetical protein